MLNSVNDVPKNTVLSVSLDLFAFAWTQKKNYERLQKALDSVMSIREMTQVQKVGRRNRTMSKRKSPSICIFFFTVLISYLADNLKTADASFVFRVLI